MKCPKCNGKTTVTDNALNTSDNEMYRKRKCLECGHIFYTTEYEVERNYKFSMEWRRYNRQYAYLNANK